MLTTTYSLIALAAEQKGARAKITLLRDYIYHAVTGSSELDATFADEILMQLNGFHDYLQSRKLDAYLIDRMRTSGLHAAQLLAELDSLGQLILNVLRWTREKLILATRYGGLYLVDFQDAIELYCNSVTKKIDKEENDLLPMAVHLLTAEDWFQIARQLLSSHPKNSVMKANSGVSAPIVSGKAGVPSGQASTNVIAISDSGSLMHAAVKTVRLSRAGQRKLDFVQEHKAG